MFRSSNLRTLTASGLVLVAGAAWIGLSVFRRVQFFPGQQFPSGRALANPFYVFAVVLLIAVALRARASDKPAGIPARRTSAKQSILLGTGLLLLLFAAYASVLALSPLSDDFALLLHASRATPASYENLFTRGQGGIMVRPLGIGLLWAQFHLWGQSPEGYRVVNLFVHFLAAIGLVLLAGDLRLGRRAAWIAGALFALHPVLPEATVWIVSLITLLAGALVIWSLHFYLRYRESNRSFHLALSLILAAGAFLSKETGYVLPFLVVGYGLILCPGESWRRRIRHWAPFGILLLLGGAYRLAVVGGIGGYSGVAGAPSFLHFDLLKTPEALLVRAPALSLQAINWSLPLSWTLKVLVVLWVGLLTFLLARNRQGPLTLRRFLFALAWIVLCALPAHNLLLVGPDLLNARNLYLPAAGGALILAMVSTLSGNGLRSRRVTLAAALILLGVYAVALQHNLQAWRLASEKTRQILGTIQQTVPEPPPQARFWIIGLPVEVNGVYVNTVGLGPALQLRYGRKDLESRVFASRAEMPEPDARTFVFRWNTEGQRLEPVAIPAPRQEARAENPSRARISFLCGRPGIDCERFVRNGEEWRRAWS